MYTEIRDVRRSDGRGDGRDTKQDARPDTFSQRRRHFRGFLDRARGAPDMSFAHRCCAIAVLLTAWLAIDSTVGHAQFRARRGASDQVEGSYIDCAVVKDRLQLRFDAAFDNPFPDRAEFFYPMCGCFSGGHGPGPPQPESRVDYQEWEAGMEVALAERFSAFAEVPVRFIDPQENADAAGLSDVRAGFKYGLIDDVDRWLTFQLRGYFPSGDGLRGLGTGHVSLEPGLLFQREYDRLTAFGEFRTWIPISNNEQSLNGVPKPFAGAVLRYGLGAGYDLYQQSCVCSGQHGCCHHDSCDDGGAHREVVTNRLTAVVELVGWDVLDGLKDNANAVPGLTSTAGASIVNLKVGLRWSTPRDSIYVSYGHALTSEVWYQNIVRVGYDYRF